MTTERLNNLHSAKPFQPFTMYLADGRGIEVTHPEALAHRPGGRTVVVLDADDRAHHVDLLLVTDLVVGERKRRPRKAS
jgi:hypothetical protein